VRISHAGHFFKPSTRRLQPESEADRPGYFCPADTQGSILGSRVFTELCLLHEAVDVAAQLAEAR
jgi:hypothetical protein